MVKDERKDAKKMKLEKCLRWDGLKMYLERASSKSGWWLALNNNYYLYMDMPTGRLNTKWIVLYLRKKFVYLQFLIAFIIYMKTRSPIFYENIKKKHIVRIFDIHTYVQINILYVNEITTDNDPIELQTRSSGNAYYYLKAT